MARGYPDYYGFSTFPKFGTAKEVEVLDIPIAAGEQKSLFSIAAKGRIYGGYLGLAYIASPTLIKIIIKIDDVLFALITPAVLKYWNLIKGSHAFIHILRYDMISENFGFGINDNITFEHEFDLAILNSHPSQTMDASGYLYYSEVR